MNKIIITFLFLVGITASSCTTSKSVVSQNVDLSKYEYASIINNDTYHIPAQLMEYEIQLFDAVEGSRLKLINDMRINELTATQQSKLLMVKYGVDVLEEKSIVTVNFIDYLTGRPIASIIRKSKFPQNPKRSVRFSGKRTKRSVQKRKARNTQKAETKVL